MGVLFDLDYETASVLWETNVNINVKWSFGRAVYWANSRLECCWRTDFCRLTLSGNIKRGKQERNLPEEKDSKQWPNWLPLCSPCHLIALRRTEKGGGREGEEEKPVISDERQILFMQIGCRVFLTMQTLVDNKLFVLGLWQFVWICKYYRGNREEGSEGRQAEITLLICNQVLR